MTRSFFWLIGFLAIFGAWEYGTTGNYIYFALPFLVLVILLTTFNIRHTYLLLLGCLPLSMEYYAPNGMSTDLPTEPLTVGLMLVWLLYVAYRPTRIDFKALLNPISILLLVHLSWIFLTAYTSQEPGISIKFFIAKIWYVITFFMFPLLLIRDEKDVRRFAIQIFVPFALVTAYIVYSHYQMDFAFTLINTAVHPFFRNHVSYAVMLALFMPFAVYVLAQYGKTYTNKVLISAGILIMLFGIATAYTRAAYIGIILSLMVYVAVRLRLMMPAVVLGIVMGIGVVFYLVADNKYLDIVPSEKTVAHTEFGSIVKATSQLKDISTMERYFRWIAAARMCSHRPMLGFGPGTFTTFYKQYSVLRFSTYVSDNPERSGTHNYYLMTLTDQGFPGLIIYLILTIFALVRGQRIWHESPRGARRGAVMAALLCLVTIDAIQLMNDMLETDKVGSLFFLSLAILVKMDRLNNHGPSKSDLETMEA